MTISAKTHQSKIKGRKKRAAAIIAAALCVCAASSCRAQNAVNLSAASGAPSKPATTEYLSGGPLAGIKLPDNPRPGGGPNELYPGSVEQYRAYWMKYTPVRSMFDAQSQLKNWKVADVAGVDKTRVTSFAPPIYRIDREIVGPMTGQKEPEVKVVRWGLNDPAFKMEFGNLPIGLYCLRVIAAVPTEKLKVFREPLYLSFSVNDKAGGGTSTYRQRISYTDDFYSVAEIYFHSDEAREYSGSIKVDAGSKVDLLVSNIILDDVLAGSTRRAVKTKRTLITGEEVAQAKKTALEGGVPATPPAALPPAERLARDAALWKWLPPINTQGGGSFEAQQAQPTIGTDTQTAEQIAAQWGTWEREWDDYDGQALLPAHLNEFLVNKKLNLKYTLDDLWAHKPLPDPFPIKDDGTGLYFPDATGDPTKGRMFAPIAGAVGTRYYRALRPSDGVDAWLANGDEDAARDAAIDLVRYAYDFPALAADIALDLSYQIETPGFRGRDVRFRHRMHLDRTYDAGQPLLAIKRYDKLFPYIKGNEELAKSIHRFVPWVNTSQDVIQLMDVYLVQQYAKNVLRYHYFVNSFWAVDAAIVLGDNSVTDPYLEWLFTRMHQYPLHTAALPDILISANERNGPQYIGSAFYAQGEGALAFSDPLFRYLEAGGNPKFNPGDPKKLPKPLAHAYWQIEKTVGGQDFFRIGDVTGPEKPVGNNLDFSSAAKWGWIFSHDPKFAWLLKNNVGRKNQTDEEWKAIETAATTVKRAPYLDLHSREVNNWAGVLESGLQHDDYRFRRAAYVRAGIGFGHNHADTLDLQVVAHGLPMTIDDGQRSGYTKPNSKFSRIHNTVEVDGKGNGEYGLESYAWTQNIADAPGAEYLRVNALPPPDAKIFNRQTALIDVDEGEGSRPLTAAQQQPKVKLPAVARTANSYVFDVFRVSGGSTHLYNFHAMIEDEFKWNVNGEKPIGAPTATYQVDSDANILDQFVNSEGKKFGGDSPSTLEATWRYSRDEKQGPFAGEQAQLGANYDANSPRKYTRLHLLGADGLRALRADVVSGQFGYRFTNMTAVKRGENLESAFAAIIEPYEGEPFLTSQKLLPIEGNETDAMRAVAVEVKTKNGHTDVNFADGRPDKTRTVGNMSFAGEFGFVSNDANGLRQATLSGGTLLSTPDVKITAAAREYSSQVKSVNYLEKQITLDKPFPIASAGRVFEIGTPDKWTSYTSAAIEGSTLTVTKGADVYRSEITQVVPEKNEVDAAIQSPLGFGAASPGAGWVASNDDATKFWHLTKANGNDFFFDKPAQKSDFPNGELRLWEYGPGDTARISTFVSLRRTENNLFELRGDADATIALKAKTIEFSSDQKTWRKLEGKNVNGLIEVSVGLSKLGAQPVYLRATK